MQKRPLLGTGWVVAGAAGRETQDGEPDWKARGLAVLSERLPGTLSKAASGPALLAFSRTESALRAPRPTLHSSDGDTEAQRGDRLEPSNSQERKTHVSEPFRYSGAHCLPEFAGLQSVHP